MFMADHWRANSQLMGSLQLLEVCFHHSGRIEGEEAMILTQAGVMSMSSLEPSRSWPRKKVSQAQ